MKQPGKHSRLWKEWRSIGQGRGPDFFMEHREAVLESLGSEFPPRQVLLSEELYATGPDYWEQLAGGPRVEWYLLPKSDLDRVISVNSSSGLCGIYPVPSISLSDLDEFPFLLVGWEIQDPGNVGTMIRSCAGLTGGGVLLVGGCNPWSAKVARASAGALMRTPVARLTQAEGQAALVQLARSGRGLFATSPRGGTELSRAAWTGRDLLIVGNESHGVPSEVLTGIQRITLFMTSQTESLNVGVAASISCYEWARNHLEGGNHG